VRPKRLRNLPNCNDIETTAQPTQYRVCHIRTVVNVLSVLDGWERREQRSAQITYAPTSIVTQRWVRPSKTPVLLITDRESPERQIHLLGFDVVAIVPRNGDGDMRSHSDARRDFRGRRRRLTLRIYISISSSCSSSSDTRLPSAAPTNAASCGDRERISRHQRPSIAAAALQRQPRWIRWQPRRRFLSVRPRRGTRQRCFDAAHAVGLGGGGSGDDRRGRPTFYMLQTLPETVLYTRRRRRAIAARARAMPRRSTAASSRQRHVRRVGRRSTSRFVGLQSATRRHRQRSARVPPVMNAVATARAAKT